MSLRVRILQIDVPAERLDEATAFWAGALGAHPVTSPAGFVHLHDARSVVEVHLQPLDGGAPRYHLDLEVMGPGGPPGEGPVAGQDVEVARRDAEVARLADLGATVGARSPDGYTVLHDPAGLPFCVIEPWAAPHNPLARRRDDRGYLEWVFLDVPADARDGEVAFWAAALGAEAGDAVDGYVPLVGIVGPGGTVDLEVQRIGGTARVHVDLSASDVEAEAARLEGLGAGRVAEIESWITLADPVGNLLCVAPPRDGA